MRVLLNLNLKDGCLVIMLKLNILENKLIENLEESPYVFIPFSSGSRNCIGQHMALIEAKILFYSMMKKF